MAANIQSELREKLSGPLDTVLAKHSEDIRRLAGNTGSMTAAALQDDVLVRKIAEYCHDAMPWPVRMAVKKPVFVDFVMANRQTLAVKLVPAAAGAGAPAVT